MKKLVLALALTGVAAPLAAESISASDKAQGAKANPDLLSQFGGRYDAPQAAYVEQVAKKVAVQSGLSNSSSDFTVTLLNSPVENAFAIPGGYIYITRQLVALMNSEAELASVMGHEVGHVAAHHANSRNRTASIGGILAGVVGAVAGNGALGQLVGRGAQQAAGLYTLKYGRDQEYQADQLGVRYSSAAGYDPNGMANALTVLSGETALEARVAGRDANAVPSWASTHPNDAQRIARARQLAQASGRAGSPSGVQDTAYLRRLDGMLFDDDPKQGVVDGRTFRHPGLRIRFAAPAGYSIANGADAVTITGSGGQAQFELAPRTEDLAGFIQRQFATLGATAGGDVRTGTTNGISYAYSTTGAAASGQAVDATLVAYRFPDATDYFLLITPRGSGPGPFTSLITSVAPLSASEAAAIRGKRIRIVAVKAGDTIDMLARGMAYTSYQRERFVALNGLTAGQALRPGMLVKVVVSG